jgi:hypothetical protein
MARPWFLRLQRCHLDRKAVRIASRSFNLARASRDGTCPPALQSTANPAWSTPAPPSVGVQKFNKLVQLDKIDLVAGRIKNTTRVFVLLNNQATDRLINNFLKPAWPFGLGSCPKVDHDADDADRVPEGDQRIWSRAHDATGLDPERPSSNISDFYYAERQPPW